MNILKLLSSFLIYLASFLDDNKQQTSTPCLTPACVNAANRILYSIDQSVNPCDDFFKFTCGNFIKKSRLDGLSSIDFRSIYDQNYSDTLNDLIKETIQANDSEPVKNMKNYYRSCIDSSYIESNGISEMMRMIDEKLGGWPLLANSTLSDDSTLKLANFSLWAAASQPFFQFSSKLNSLTPKEFSLTLTISDFLLEFQVANQANQNQSSSLAANQQDAYAQFAREILEAFGISNSTNPNYLSDIKGMIDLLFQFVQLLDNQPEEMPKQLTVSDLELLLPDVTIYTFEWRKFLVEGLFRANGSYLKNVSFNIETDQIAVFNFDFLLNATQLYKNALDTRREFLPNGFTDMEMKHFADVGMGSSRFDRESSCLTETNKLFNYVLTQQYIKRHFNESDRSVIELMAEHLRSELKNMLDEAVWMDTDSRANAIDKLNSIQVNLAYPPSIMDPNYMNAKFGRRELEMSSSSYLNNYLNFMKNVTLASFLNLGLTVSQIDQEWPMSPIESFNAAYSSQTNQIYITAGIMQTPFYTAGQPNYLNYGALGFAVGHEFTHGFDSIGITFDKFGNRLLNGYCWSNSTIENYQNRSTCFIKQYGNYTIEQIGIQSDGQKTLDENIADNGGIRESYRAYKRWERMKGATEKGLPALPYTPDQLFFIALAQPWCVKLTDESYALSLEKGTHSMGEVRVNVLIANSDDFSNAFKCSVNQPKVLQSKCRIW